MRTYISMIKQLQLTVYNSYRLCNAPDNSVGLISLGCFKVARSAKEGRRDRPAPKPVLEVGLLIGPPSRDLALGILAPPVPADNWYCRVQASATLACAQYQYGCQREHGTTDAHSH